MTIKDTSPHLQPVPSIPLDAPLASEGAFSSPPIDEVMASARKSWIIGFVLFLIFVLAVGFVGYEYYVSIFVHPTLPPL